MSANTVPIANRHPDTGTGTHLHGCFDRQRQHLGGGRGVRERCESWAEGAAGGSGSTWLASASSASRRACRAAAFSNASLPNPTPKSTPQEKSVRSSHHGHTDRH